ncbi:MAG: DNA polymerase III subunit gamma/tau, partial [Pseudomonadota bacterium]
CVGPDGSGAPTTEPCGQCEHCKGIMTGTHVDVIEMDGASQTKIDDIRSNILDSVHYAPASARFKIYIIDEVHMLSTSAFNALLKTLEEPPAHVKFIFATTEIRKVPVTVLSRCQRFDLRRIEPEVMIAHLRRIAVAEGAAIAEDALALITRAAEGSVRDAMSLLDQAISHGAGETTADQVRAMLGLADRGRVMDLFDRVMSGDAAAALAELSGQYSDGADPVAVLRDLAEVTHWVSVIKITPDAAEDPTVSPDERARGLASAEALPMRALTRMWQMLLKSLEEVAHSPNAMMAAEMAVIRLTHVADLPSPEELVRKLQDAPVPPAPAGPRPNTPSPGGGITARSAPASTAGGVPVPQRPSASGGGAALAVASVSEQALSRFASFAQVVDLIRANRDVKLLVEVETCLRLASYSPGRIAFSPTDNAPGDLAARLGQKLQTWTGARWAVSVENGCEAATIAETRDAARLEEEARAMDHPLVAAVFAAFPEAKIAEIRSHAELAQDAAVEALPEVEDEWDPFEDD